MKCTLLKVLPLLAACAPSLIAANDDGFLATHLRSTEGVAGVPDTLLIEREKQKWQALESGKWTSVADWFDEHFIAISYGVMGSPKMTNKAQTFAVNPRLPPGVGFALKDFKVIRANGETSVVTYLARGPVAFYASSVWVKRDGEWKTIFYQATRME